jgi:hypothetical protein
MQLATLSGSGTTCRTVDGGYLFRREFALFHSDRMRLHLVANLFNFGHWFATAERKAKTVRGSGSPSIRSVALELGIPIVGRFAPLQPVSKHACTQRCGIRWCPRKIQQHQIVGHRSLAREESHILTTLCLLRRLQKLVVLHPHR